MRATFEKAVVWEIKAECLTPLRTGIVDGDTETVLRSHDGTAMVQGSSIAGCLRSWIEQSTYKDRSNALFGSQETAGPLRISDGMFEKNSEMLIRPRLKMDGITGTAEDKKKFDLAHIQTGSYFSFTVTLLGNDISQDVTALEAALSALDCGDITMGAQKTNGFGRVKLAEVKKCSLDLKNPKDRDAWLNDEFPWDDSFTLPTMERTAKAVFTVVGTFENLLVKSPQTESFMVDDTNRDLTVNLREGDKPVLPGSSIKGALRARVEKIAKYMGLSEKLIESVFGTNPKRKTAVGEDGEIKKLSPGKVICRDVYLSGQKSAKISRIRINKFTGGVMRQALFTEEPVSGKVTLKISVESGCRAGCALVLYALRDLGLGLWNLGSNGSIGRGFLKVREISASVPDGRQLKLVFSESDGRTVCKAEDPSHLAEDWIKALKEEKA